MRRLESLPAFSSAGRLSRVPQVRRRQAALARSTSFGPSRSTVSSSLRHLCVGRFGFHADQLHQGVSGPLAVARFQPVHDVGQVLLGKRFLVRRRAVRLSRRRAYRAAVFRRKAVRACAAGKKDACRDRTNPPHACHALRRAWAKRTIRRPWPVRRNGRRCPPCQPQRSSTWACGRGPRRRRPRSAGAFPWRKAPSASGPAPPRADS